MQPGAHIITASQPAAARRPATVLLLAMALAGIRAEAQQDPPLSQGTAPRTLEMRPSDEPDSQQKVMFGYLERVVISTAGLALDAKLDTGADTSSLHAEGIKRFKRMGDRFVRFQVREDSGELVTLERPLSRMARIRRHDGDYQRRPVVKMWICVGNTRRRVEVNLIDRSQFSYPFLLGRSAMEGAIIVDPDRTFTVQPECDLKGMDQ